MTNIIDVSNNTNLKNIDKKEYEEDKLNKEELAKSFANIISKNNWQVITINAPWGNGKTFFIDNLLIKILQSEAVCIKYNVWESDYFDNPLIPLLAEITNSLNSKKLTKLKDDAKKFIKSYSFGLSALGSFEVSYTENDEDIFTDYKEKKENIDKFKTSLSKITKEIKRPIIIFVDELDRCRPDYAIKTLEVIKHFFNIENVKFVLAVDKEQINNSIKTLYGINTETDGFLRKFVDLELFLPEPSAEAWAMHLVKKFGIENKLSDFHKLNRCFGCDVNNLCKRAASLGESFGFKLRDYERIFTRIKIIIDNLNPEKDVLLLEYLTFLVFAQFKNKEIFNSFVSLRNITSEEFENILGKDGLHKFDINYYNRLFSLFRSHLNPVKDPYGRINYEKFNKYLYGCENAEYKHQTLIDIIYFVRNNSSFSEYEKLKYIFEDYIKKIELVETILREDKESL